MFVPVGFTLGAGPPQVRQSCLPLLQVHGVQLDVEVMPKRQGCGLKQNSLLSCDIAGTAGSQPSWA